MYKEVVLAEICDFLPVTHCAPVDWYISTLAILAVSEVIRISTASRAVGSRTLS